MNRTMTSLLLASCFSFYACDMDSPTAVSSLDGEFRASPGYDALSALGKSRQIVKPSAEQRRALIGRALVSPEAAQLVEHREAMGFVFEDASISAFWTDGATSRVGTVVQRGRGDGQAVLVISVLDEELEVLGTFEATDDIATFKVYDMFDDGTPDPMLLIEVEPWFTADLREDVLAGLQRPDRRRQCALRDAMIDVGASLDAATCTADGNLVCLWSKFGDFRAYNRCLVELTMVCDPAADKNACE